MMVELWVRRLNAQARRMDEIAAGVHPGAWPEILAEENRRWREMARRGAR